MGKILLYKVKKCINVIFSSIEADSSISLSAIGFSGMLNIMMGSESRPTICTALLRFFFKWPPFIQGQTINLKTFRQNRSRFVIFFERQF